MIKLITFEVTRTHPELVDSDISTTYSFYDESKVFDTEYISQDQILEAVNPYLKDPVGIHVVYSSNTLIGTPITKIEIITYSGELLVGMERSDNS